MKDFLHILLHSLEDTAFIVPVLFIMYFLIEFLEYKNVFKFRNSKLLNGKASPVIGSLVGCIPQCGFSVISAELYTKQKISIGALIAVFISTSDEALPLMLTNYKYIPSLLMLIITKVILGIIIGYISLFLYKKIFKKSTIKHIYIKNEEHHEHHKEDHEKENEHIHACCHHDTLSTKFNWKHPLLHSIKISFYILLINFIMGTIIHFVGEHNLVEFLKSGNVFQPLFAVIIGLIPNCVSSVVLTELYLMGGLSFGSIIAGLSVNAGIAYLVLLKQNKNIKESLFILTLSIVASLIFGYALHFLPINLL